MQEKGLTWLGLRTTQFEEMVTFFRDVMGMQPVRDQPEIAGFQLTDSTQVELYRPEEKFHKFFTVVTRIFRNKKLKLADTFILLSTGLWNYDLHLSS